MRKFINQICMEQWISQNISMSILNLWVFYNDLWPLIFTLSRWYLDNVCEVLYTVLKTEIVKHITPSTIQVCLIAISCNVTLCAVELNILRILVTCYMWKCRQPSCLNISNLSFGCPENFSMKNRINENVKIYVSFLPKTCDIHIYV